MSMYMYITTTTDDTFSDPLQDAPPHPARRRTAPREDVTALIARGDALVLELQLTLAELRRRLWGDDANT